MPVRSPLKRGYLLMEAAVGGTVLAASLFAIIMITTATIKANDTARARSTAASLVAQRIEEVSGLGYANLAAGTTTETLGLNGAEFTRTTANTAGVEPYDATIANMLVVVTVDFRVHGRPSSVTAQTVLVEETP